MTVEVVQAIGVFIVVPICILKDRGLDAHLFCVEQQ